MGSTWGNTIKISIFGESHGTGIGVVIDGFPSGVMYDEAFVLREIDRRNDRAAHAEHQAQPRAEREQHRRPAAAERACVKLCQRSAVCIVCQIHRHTLERLLHQRLERHIVKAQVVGVDDALAGLVDAAGNDNADALEMPARNVLLLQQEIDRFLDGFDHASRAVVREPDAAALQQLQRFAHKTDLDIGSADIHTNLIHVTHPPSRLRRAGQTAS